MKFNSSLLAILIFLVSFSFQGCRKNIIDDKWNWSSNYPFSFNLDGESIYANESQALLIKYPDSYCVVCYLNHKKFLLNFRKEIASGVEYELYGNNTKNHIYIEDSITGITIATWFAKQGRIKILEFDEQHIKGLFFCDMRGNNNKSTYKGAITKGYFNLKFRN